MSQRNQTETPIHPLLAERWSPRGFDASFELSVDELKALFEAARWAPSASNKQPWGYVVARRGTETFEKIFATLRDFNQAWTDRAAALVVTYVRVEDYTGIEPLAYHDMGQASAHLTVQAESMGLDVHQMAGFDVAAVAEAFEVPEGYAPLTVIAIGKHSADDDVPEAVRMRDAGARERRPLDDVLLLPIS